MRPHAVVSGGTARDRGYLELLARPERQIDHAGITALIDGRRVLVTGAGGTIGAELTRQIAALAPGALVLMDASELNLFNIDQELRQTAPAAPWRLELGDIRDKSRVEDVFRRNRPEIVLHAAALKHVSLMELTPSEAVLTNILGAMNIAESVVAHGAALVFISTDKAVNPANVMGVTKRLAERTLQGLSGDSGMRGAIVRFGNVLGSTGSVVSLFERQITQGGPVTVSDVDVARWFMTVREASNLVLQAAALPAEPGKAATYVFDMGQPVRIDDLARRLIRRRGLVAEADIAIVYTGLRSGEKLREELFYTHESVVPTSVPGLLVAHTDHADWTALRTRLPDLIEAARAHDAREVVRGLRALEPSFTPSPRLTDRVNGEHPRA